MLIKLEDTISTVAYIFNVPREMEYHWEISSVLPGDIVSAAGDVHYTGDFYQHTQKDVFSIPVLC